MPVVFQKIYRRDDARRNPSVLYVFGDNVKRVGDRGQAAEMRLEPNAIGIATKYTPDLCFGNEPEQVSAQNRVVDHDMKRLFEHVKKGGIVVWPSDGVGTGTAFLPERSPDTYDYLESKLKALLHVGELFRQGRGNAAERKAAEHT